MMSTPQSSASRSQIESHNELLRNLFSSVIENVYELLIQNESSLDIHGSNIVTENLKICQHYPEEHFENAISMTHYNDYNLHLLNTDWKKCEKFNIPLLCKFIGNRPINIPPPFVVIKINSPILEKYIGDDKVIKNAFANMKLIIVPDEVHKIKVCKYRKLHILYIIIFFDSLTYNETHVFREHDVIKNLNDYDEVGRRPKDKWYNEILYKLFCL